ncbi:MAG TPA: hypothetical protein VKF41_00160 [Bryobacteraceae bacterium]|nr:hypothetical protein [Bryobacteraceae bacterium]
MDSRTRSLVPFALAYGAAVLVAFIGWREFARNPPPRYGDLFLPGVALLATKRSWKAGACLLAAAVTMMLAVVTPLTLRKLLGFGIFTATGSMIVWVVELAKRRGTNPPDAGKP